MVIKLIAKINYKAHVITLITRRVHALMRTWICWTNRIRSIKLATRSISILAHIMLTCWQSCKWSIKLNIWMKNKHISIMKLKRTQACVKRLCLYIMKIKFPSLIYRIFLHFKKIILQSFFIIVLVQSIQHLKQSFSIPYIIFHFFSLFKFIWFKPNIYLPVKIFQKTFSLFYLLLDFFILESRIAVINFVNVI